jgi:hypothetical protein
MLRARLGPDGQGPDGPARRRRALEDVKKVVTTSDNIRLSSGD